MSVVDASVWVSICHAGDRHHERSREWLEERLVGEARLVAPSLLCAEVAAAVRRLTGDRKLASSASSALAEADWIDFYDLTSERAGRAGEIAASTGVRGADAVYLQLAVERGEELVTWDRQQLERGRRVARVVTP